MTMDRKIARIDEMQAAAAEAGQNNDKAQEFYDLARDLIRRSARDGGFRVQLVDDEQQRGIILHQGRARPDGWQSMLGKLWNRQEYSITQRKETGIISQGVQMAGFVPMFQLHKTHRTVTDIMNKDMKTAVDGWITRFCPARPAGPGN